MDFFLFLLVNFTLFVRPGELVPGLEEVPIYNILILAASVLAAPRLADRLRPKSLIYDPATSCVLAIVPAVILSHVAHLSGANLAAARLSAWDFSKTVVYYLVLVAVVNTAARVRLFLYAIATFAALSASLAVLHYFEIISIPTLTVLQEVGGVDEQTGAQVFIPRLRATGIFNDPNDLSMIAVLGIIISLFGIGDSRLGISRVAWCLPLGLFLTTLFLTRSRGGALALLAGVGLLSCFRVGVLKSAVFAPPVVLAVLLFLGGRQTDIGGAMSGGTGAARVELWSAGLIALKDAPIFGVGYGNYSDYAGQVAHNSFLHCFVELGLVGGGLFLGAFWISGCNLWKLCVAVRSEMGAMTRGNLRRIAPYAAAALCAFVVSMLSLTRCYVVPTYLVLGAANACCRQAGGLPALRWNARLAGLLLLVSVIYVAGIYAFVRLAVR